MFSATIKKASLLKKIATVLNNLFHSISISVKDDALCILMVTTCKYMLFDISLELEDLNIDQPITFSVNAKYFLESFSTIKANDSVKLRLVGNEFIVEIISDGCTERTYLYVSETQTLSIGSEPDYENSIEIKDLNFQKLCKAMNNASRELIIKGNSRRVTLRANLEKLYGREIEFGDSSFQQDDFEDVYFTEHLLSVSKISTLSNSLLFYVQQGNPLCIEARFNSGLFKVFVRNKTMVEEEV